MTIEAITVLAKTSVDLANVVMVMYGIQAAKDFVNHWLDSFPRRDPRTPVQIAQDQVNEVVNGE